MCKFSMYNGNDVSDLLQEYAMCILQESEEEDEEDDDDEEEEEAETTPGTASSGGTSGKPKKDQEDLEHKHAAKLQACPLARRVNIWIFPHVT